MIDEELIARLRSMHWCVTTKANGVGVSDEAVAPEAADRIEALLNLNEALVELMDDRDAKLTKVVEALPRWILAMGDWDQGGEQAIEEMTAALAEIQNKP